MLGPRKWFHKRPFDSEDGFVLYTADQHKRYKQCDYNPGTSNFKSYENVQQSCPYPPSGSTPYTMSTASTAGKLTTQKKNTTFLTVSDLPMELSKQLQAMIQINQGTSDVLRRSSPNIDQYHYDFSLERAVIRSFEGHS
ncbi:hypothetical protein OS493_006622 [Desmophyllum pertusum]|uniref:UMA domain-containing protein n=1 Tax=Desmophyllum pertusum TaxID=174260 RepID=A0A9X0D455_9CNID|nr:hypothetical protein OS493_006622 [Desmophyllum pertusum]